MPQVDARPTNRTGGMNGPLRPAEVGSAFALGHRPWFTDDGHLHVGYASEQANRPGADPATDEPRQEDRPGSSVVLAWPPAQVRAE
jgi:hypothetical protein